MNEPGFWQRADAEALSQEFGEVNETVKRFHSFEQKFKELDQSREVAEQFSDDTALGEELARQIEVVSEWFKNEEALLALSGKYDKVSALLTFYSGAGGREAEDWATMLSLSESASIPTGSYSELLMTSEWSALDNPPVYEHKYYAKGLGFILTKYVEGGYELKLVEIRNT